MFKKLSGWLFCEHEMRVLDRYYIVTEEEYNIIVTAYRLEKCEKCNSYYDTEVFSFEEINDKIQSVKDCIAKLEQHGYKDEVTFELTRGVKL